MVKNYYLKLIFKKGANDRLKQIKKKTAFKQMIDGNWRKITKYIWWTIFYYKDQFFFREILPNLENFVRLNRKKSLTKLFQSNNEKDIRFYAKYVWNPYSYLIDFQYPDEGDGGLSTVEIERIGPVIMVMSDSQMIKGKAPFIMKEEYNDEEKFTEYQLTSKDTLDESKEILQVFLWNVKKELTVLKSWLKERGIRIEDIVNIEYNIPPWTQELIDQVVDKSLVKSRKKYHINLIINESTNELLRKKRIKSKFYSSINSAWNQTITAIRKLIPRYENGTLVKKLKEEIDNQVVKIYRKKINEFNENLLSDMWFQEFFRLDIENYLLKDSNTVDNVQIPDISLFEYSKWIFQTNLGGSDVLFFMNLFFYILKETLEIWMTWLKEKEIMLSNLIEIKKNFQLDYLDEIRSFLKTKEENTVKKGLKFITFKDPPISISEICIYDRATKLAGEWINDQLEQIRTDSNWKIVSNFKYSFSDYYYFRDEHQTTPNQIEVYWKDPEERIPDFLQKFVTKFFGNIMFLIENRLERISILYGFDWKEFFKVEPVNIESIKCKDPDDKKLTYPRMSVKVIKTEKELRKLRIKTFVRKGFNDIVWAGINKIREKYSVKDSFEHRWSGHSGLDECTHEDFQYYITWLDNERDESKKFFKDLKSFYIREYPKYFQQKNLDWHEFIKIK